MLAILSFFLLFHDLAIRKKIDDVTALTNSDDVSEQRVKMPNVLVSVRFPPWSGIFFSLPGVDVKSNTVQTSFSPECITPS